jgi:hypothetical protein
VIQAVSEGVSINECLVQTETHPMNSVSYEVEMKLFRPLDMDELFAMIYGSLGSVDIHSMTQTPKREAYDLSQYEIGE